MFENVTEKYYYVHARLDESTEEDDLTDRKRKYNNPSDLDELCRSFLTCQEKDRGAALEYCKDFLALLSKKDVSSGAVVSSRSRPR